MNNCDLGSDAGLYWESPGARSQVPHVGFSLQQPIKRAPSLDPSSYLEL